MGCDLILPVVMFSKMDGLIGIRCKEPSLRKIKLMMALDGYSR